MTAPIAVWLHARLSGGAVNTPHAIRILQEQMKALTVSGLFTRAARVFVCCSAEDAPTVNSLVPHGTLVTLLPAGARSELPTLALLREWLTAHADYYVFYHHLKCATRTDDLCKAWRGCMTRHLVHGWQKCVEKLDAGCDAVGTHWLTPEQYPKLVAFPYFGGNYWWASALFLLTRFSIPATAQRREEFYLAESWIGMGKRPRIHDFHPQWPNMNCARS